MGFGPAWPKSRGRRVGSRPIRAGAGRQKLVRILSLLVLGILAAVASRFGEPAVQGHLAGLPRLIDGDSFFLNGNEVRLQGIDAPEGPQTCTREGKLWQCGEDAKRTLQRLTSGQPIRCDRHGSDQHGRFLATCFASSGTNLNRAMVREGFALAFGSSYRSEEAEARSARRGLWQSEFERPQDWRRRTQAGS